jgi:hypothetical protein
MRAIVYKNLRRGDWSIATPTGREGTGRGKVTDHRASVILANPVFIVQESGRLRVLRVKQREVHAWVCGDIVDALPAGMTAREITYNPYRCGSFTARDGLPIGKCDFVEFTESGVAIAYAREA